MLTINTRLQGRYDIVRQIGHGGMGMVYEAMDIRLARRVAVKQLTSQAGQANQAFEHEARLLASLDHPALPQVTDYFSDASGQFLVMEYVPGENLGEQLAKNGRPFPVRQALQWADQLLDVLEYLHGRTPPIVHRDIKPENLKLSESGRIMLLDFGLAKGSARPQPQLGSPASVFGYTPHYAPLEQIQGTGTGARSDVYALGATLYHLITGGLPPDSLTRVASVLNEQRDPLLPAHRLNPLVSRSLSELIAQALAVRKEDRPTSSALRKKLADLGYGDDSPGSAPAPARPARTAQPTARPPAQPQELRHYMPPDVPLAGERSLELPPEPAELPAPSWHEYVERLSTRFLVSLVGIGVFLLIFPRTRIGTFGLRFGIGIICLSLGLLLLKIAAERSRFGYPALLFFVLSGGLVLSAVAVVLQLL